MKNSTILLSAMALLITFSSCKKIKEATQRDIQITPTAITFTIPIITSTAAGTSFGTYNESLDLDALIKTYASEFGEDNVKNIKISSVTLELLNQDADNNVQNFESINVALQTGSGAPVTIAAAASIPNTSAPSITVPVSGTTDLKSYLGATSFSYAVTGKLRKATTKVLNAKLTAQYTATVGL
jgi:hypothetical protein